MQQLILILHLLAAISIIALVLLQQGKGADIGATFGGGASNTVFGSQGSVPFLMKLTVGLGVIFFITSIGLTYLAHRAQAQNNSMNVAKMMSSVSTEPVTTQPTN